jgi:hypothetical protein
MPNKHGYVGIMSAGRSHGLAGLSRQGSFSPASLGGLVALYDPTQGLTQASNLVSAWNDQSGTGDSNKNLTAAGAARPTYNATDAAYGNQPTLSFAGAQWLEGAGAWASPQAQPATWYVVGESTVSGGRLIDGDATGRNAFVDNTGNMSLYAGTAFIGNGGNAKAVYCGVFNGASSALYVSTITTPTTTGNPGSNACNRCVVGAFDGGVGPLTGKVAYVLGYSGSHSASQRGQVMNFLGARFGISVTP